MWAAVSARHHVVSGVYAAVDGKDEVMLFGHVDYSLKNGRDLATEWSARMVFDGTGEKLALYQVWLDASPMIVALGKRIEADEAGAMRVV